MLCVAGWSEMGRELPQGGTCGRVLDPERHLYNAEPLLLQQLMI